MRYTFSRGNICWHQLIITVSQQIRKTTFTIEYIVCLHIFVHIYYKYNSFKIYIYIYIYMIWLLCFHQIWLTIGLIPNLTQLAVHFESCFHFINNVKTHCLSNVGQKFCFKFLCMLQLYWCKRMMTLWWFNLIDVECIIETLNHKEGKENTWDVIDRINKL